MKAYNAIEWTPEMVLSLRNNHHAKTNQQLADELGLKITSVRHKCYELGLYKMRLQYWTDDQIQFLKDNYQKKGDTELAMLFTEKWEKDKGWTKKHIEKKRRYLNLKRTDEEKKTIREDWTRKGLYKESVRKRWITTGVSAIGTIKIWDGRKFIKTETGFIPLRTYNYKKYNGEVLKDKIVCHKDGDQLNCEPENLILLTREENALKTHQENFSLEHLETHLLISRINRKIKQINRNHGKKQITRP
ncbi:hypothetical protein J2X97_000365 [Epilithonimonas hungarica]|uniref:HNH endonuclease signature motif containing protein n=1 Tax=Epilithonimonas hungarica TaxID=454006 RepID=UPI002784B501|nr:HNH endonuclease signature motif containing protein [Epilithonimonas hungarica]MDP9954728.1 hypothetical protein [Epilithonimonas hungarica]